MRTATTAVISSLLLLAPRPARAEDDAPRIEDVSWLGPARAVPKASSASRDAPALNLMLLPRPVLMGGGELSLATVRGRASTWRVGFLGFLELESETETIRGAPLPSGDIRFWRGHFGYTLAVAWDRLSERWCGPECTVETTVSWHHESEHYTGSNAGDPGTDYSDRPHIGDFLMLDGAARVPLGQWALTLRVQNKFFIPGRSGYAQGPGADLMLRWKRWDKAHPFTAIFGEYLFGDRGFPDAYLVRALAGVALPSKHGDISFYASADVGHRKGLAVFTEEATLGFGIRAAFTGDHR